MFRRLSIESQQVLGSYLTAVLGWLHHGMRDENGIETCSSIISIYRYVLMQHAPSKQDVCACKGGGEINVVS